MDIARLMRHKYELMHKKVEINDIRFIRRAFEKTFIDNLDRCLFNNITLFECALEHGHSEIVDFLIDLYGQDLFTGHQGQNMFSSILSRSASPSFEASDECTALIIQLFKCSVPNNAFSVALYKLPIQTCKKILETFPMRNYVNILHKNEMTTLHIAVDTESFEKVHLLTIYNASVHKWNDLLPSEYAILKDSSLKIIELLIKHEKEFGFEISDSRKDVLDMLHDENDHNNIIVRDFLKDMISIGKELTPEIRMCLLTERQNLRWHISSRYDPLSPLQRTRMTVKELLAIARYFHEDETPSSIPRLYIEEANLIHSCIKGFLEYLSARMGDFAFEPKLGGSVNENTKIFLGFNAVTSTVHNIVRVRTAVQRVMCVRSKEQRFVDGRTTK